MEILDKNTPGFTVSNKTGGKPMITFTKSELYISSAACREFGLEDGSRLHFVHDIDRLYFYVDDEKAGLPLYSANSSKSALRVRCITMINILKNKMPTIINPPISFPLKKSVTKVNGNQTIEVLIHKKVK